VTKFFEIGQILEEIYRKALKESSNYEYHRVEMKIFEFFSQKCWENLFHFLQKKLTKSTVNNAKFCKIFR
jgi:hypothetical protein